MSSGGAVCLSDETYNSKMLNIVFIYLWHMYGHRLLNVCVIFQKQDDKLAGVYQPIRRQLTNTVETDLAHLLAAREGKV